MLSFLNFLIQWSFYALFFLVPLAFTSNTSELFELNKMWLTFGLALVIAASWIGKMVLERQIRIQKTPLDIFIGLFLISQLASTIFSMDVHTSFWGYYSRFNGGFLSLVTYAFLFYAFVTNIEAKDYFKHILVSIVSGVFVALWGLPSHFGYDPTCLLFRGTFDVSCWTDAFQPKVRIFSTLGQPDWLAAYLVYLLPLTTALGLIWYKNKQKLLALSSLLITLLFFVDLLYTRARSGFVGVVAALVVFFAYYAFDNKRYLKHLLKNPVQKIQKSWYTLALLVSLVVVTFFIGTPISQLSFFTPDGIAHLFVHQAPPKAAPVAPAPKTTAVPTQEFGGTDSGKIRLFVWKGAIDIFLHNPLFGTGVETFAYAYYQYRPAGHNLTSEWDYLYNKAHNEFLNYLATTGAFGFGAYMAMLIAALWLMGKGLWVMSHGSEEDKTSNPRHSSLITASLLASYVSILVTNFFGFSVVIMNIFLFLTPAFAFYALNMLDTNAVFALPKSGRALKRPNELQWIFLGGIGLATTYFMIILIRFWLADTSYALGQNFDHANEYQAAYSYLHDAVQTRPDEPVFQDELTINDAVLATAFAQQKDTQNASKLAQEAIQVSNNITTSYPNDITYWKTRVRVMYTLSQIDPQYLPIALQAIQKAHELAPTDAKVSYNLGLLYAQTGDLQKAMDTLQETIKLRPIYTDAYYALALYSHEAALDKNGRIVNPDLEKKAVDTMHFILTNFDPTDTLKIHATLKSWKEE